MLAENPIARGAGRLLLGLALGIPCLMAGCGGGGSGDKPAQFDPEVAKKNQDLMSGGYRDAIYADAKAKGKVKEAAKKK
jgi:hypothetical protein